MPATWESKVQQVIGVLAATAYKKANYNKQGRKYKKHRPYRIPEEADQLVQCLGDRNRKRGEITCKRIMEGLRQAQVPIDRTR